MEANENEWKRMEVILLKDTQAFAKMFSLQINVKAQEALPVLSFEEELYKSTAEL